jgi:hypothetical protein
VTGLQSYPVNQHREGQRSAGPGACRGLPRERDELRADLRARAERAERQADADRDEIHRLRVATGRGTGTTSTPGKSTRATRGQAAHT